MAHRNSKCFVPNCKTGYKTCRDKFSLFRAPKDKAELELWRKYIPRGDKNISERDVVCEKHFDSSDIIKSVIIDNVSKYCIADYNLPKS